MARNNLPFAYKSPFTEYVMKKIFLLTLAASAAAFFAGCGDDSSTGSSKGDTSSGEKNPPALDEECGEEYEGSIVLFKTSKKEYICEDGEWIPYEEKDCEEDECDDDDGKDDDSDDEESVGGKSSSSTKASSSSKRGSIFDDDDDGSDDDSDSNDSDDSNSGDSDDDEPASSTSKSSSSTVKSSSSTKGSSSSAAKSSSSKVSSSMEGMDCSAFGDGVELTKDGVVYVCSDNVWTIKKTSTASSSSSKVSEELVDFDFTGMGPSVPMFETWEIYNDPKSVCIIEGTELKNPAAKMTGISAEIACGKVPTSKDAAYAGTSFQMFEGGEDIRDWEGLCVVYEASNGVRMSMIPSNEEEYTGYNNYGIQLPATKKISTVNKKWGSFTQETWGGHLVGLNEFLSAVTGLKFQKDGQDINVTYRILKVGRYGDCGPVSETDQEEAESVEHILKYDIYGRMKLDYGYDEFTHGWEGYSGNGHINTGFSVANKNGDYDGGYWYSVAVDGSFEYPVEVDEDLAWRLADYCRGYCGTATVDKKNGDVFVGFNLVNSDLVGGNMRPYGGIQIAYVSTDMPITLVLINEDSPETGLYYYAVLPATGSDGLNEMDIPWSKFVPTMETDISIDEYVKKISAVHLKFQEVGSTIFNIRAIGWGSGEGSAVKLPELENEYAWGGNVYRLDIRVKTGYEISEYPTAGYWYHVQENGSITYPYDVDRDGSFKDIIYQCRGICGVMESDIDENGALFIGFNIVDEEQDHANLTNREGISIAYGNTEKDLVVSLYSRGINDLRYKAILPATGYGKFDEVTIPWENFEASTASAISRATFLKYVSALRIGLESEGSTEFLIRAVDFAGDKSPLSSFRPIQMKEQAEWEGERAYSYLWDVNDEYSSWGVKTGFEDRYYEWERNGRWYRTSVLGSVRYGSDNDDVIVSPNIDFCHGACGAMIVEEGMDYAYAGVGFNLASSRNYTVDMSNGHLGIYIAYSGNTEDLTLNLISAESEESGLVFKVNLPAAGAEIVEKHFAWDDFEANMATEISAKDYVSAVKNVEIRLDHPGVTEFNIRAYGLEDGYGEMMYH